MGIITSITLQCEPFFWINVEEEISTLAKFISEYKQLNDEIISLVWDIKTDAVTISRSSKIKTLDTSNYPGPIKCFQAFNNYILNDEDKVFAGLEIAIPIAKLPEALERVKALIKKHWHADAPIESDAVVRFTHADANSYLSPTSEQDVAYLNLWISHKDYDYLAFCNELEEVLINLGARPHWGKVNTLTYEKALQLYGENLHKFIAIKQRLDPHGIFSNVFIDRICKPKDN